MLALTINSECLLPDVSLPHSPHTPKGNNRPILCTSISQDEALYEFEFKRRSLTWVILVIGTMKVIPSFFPSFL